MRRFRFVNSICGSLVSCLIALAVGHMGALAAALFPCSPLTTKLRLLAVTTAILRAAWRFDRLKSPELAEGQPGELRSRGDAKTAARVMKRPWKILPYSF